MIPWNKQKWGDDLIVPGERIGGFILGKQPSEFLPDDSEATIADWSGRESVGVEISEEHGLVDATTGNVRFHTAEGFKVGSALDDLIAAWGEPDDRNALDNMEYFDFKAAWTRRGVDVAVKDGKVIYIGVFKSEP
jgi:hypothetical protein